MEELPMNPRAAGCAVHDGGWEEGRSLVPGAPVELPDECTRRAYYTEPPSSCRKATCKLSILPSRIRKLHKKVPAPKAEGVGHAERPRHREEAG
jgi:hypothetical protein